MVRVTTRKNIVQKNSSDPLIFLLELPREFFGLPRKFIRLFLELHGLQFSRSSLRINWTFPDFLDVFKNFRTSLKFHGLSRVVNPRHIQLVCNQKRIFTYTAVDGISMVFISSVIDILDSCFISSAGIRRSPLLKVDIFNYFISLFNCLFSFIFMVIFDFIYLDLSLHYFLLDQCPEPISIFLSQNFKTNLGHVIKFQSAYLSSVVPFSATILRESAGKSSMP